MRVFYLALSALLISCSQQHKEGYYYTHPTALIDVLKHCPQRSPSGLSCEQAQTLAQTFRSMAYELQQDPQVFGQKIIDLQIAYTKPDLTSADKDVYTKELAMRLAVVRWLESPET